MNLEEYIHNRADKNISLSVFNELKGLLESIEFSYQQYSAKQLRRTILHKIGEIGWSDEVRIHPSSRITITSVNDGIALCLQTGNMSRFYADLLKLETLYKNGEIKAAFYIICTKENAVHLGSNIANFERFKFELEIFKETITIPILVFGLC